jgi:hypothetical protein
MDLERHSYGIEMHLRLSDPSFFSPSASHTAWALESPTT